jgi:hypothetical protein
VKAQFLGADLDRKGGEESHAVLTTVTYTWLAPRLITLLQDNIDDPVLHDDDLFSR